MIITRSENDGNKKIRNIFSNLFTIVIIIIAVVIYRQYDFNFFTKGILGEGKTQFSRDANEKYSKTRSYKIDNILENDAMFFRTVPVTPNTPYKVTCMVKTKNIEKYCDKLVSKNKKQEISHETDGISLIIVQKNKEK